MLSAMSRWFVIAIALCGCRDSEIAKMQSIRDQVCKCTTPECAEDAIKQLPTREGRASPHAQQLANEMLTCLAKVYAAGRPSTDADAPVDSSDGGAVP